MSEDVREIRKEFREEISSPKMRFGATFLTRSSGADSISFDPHKYDGAQTEPSFVVKDLVRQIREDVKSSQATRGGSRYRNRFWGLRLRGAFKISFMPLSTQEF